MIITQHVGISLVRSARTIALVGRNERTGRGWSCEVCGYESRTVFTDTLAASASHQYHRETWCDLRSSPLA